MDQIQGLITFLQALIPIGAGARIVYSLMAMAADSEEEHSYRKRIRNALVFVVLAEVISGLLQLVLDYF